MGALVLASSAASCSRAGSTSKKTPHDVDAFLQFGEAVLQILYVLSHARIVTAKIEIQKSKVNAGEPYFTSRTVRPDVTYFVPSSKMCPSSTATQGLENFAAGKQSRAFSTFERSARLKLDGLQAA